MVPVAVAAPVFRDVGVSVYVHTTPGLCVTVNVVPAMDSVPVRLVVPVLGMTAYVAVPTPLPTKLPVMVIHGTPLSAIQTQPVGADTLTLPVPADDVND